MEKNCRLIIFNRQILYLLTFFLKNTSSAAYLKVIKKLIFKILEILRFNTVAPPKVHYLLASSSEIMTVRNYKFQILGYLKNLCKIIVKLYATSQTTSLTTIF